MRDFCHAELAEASVEIEILRSAQDDKTLFYDSQLRGSGFMFDYQFSIKDNQLHSLSLS
jgi:hypothetical protein